MDAAAERKAGDESDTESVFGREEKEEKEEKDEKERKEAKEEKKEKKSVKPKTKKEKQQEKKDRCPFCACLLMVSFLLAFLLEPKRRWPRFYMSLSR